MNNEIQHTKEPWIYGGTPVSNKEDLMRIFVESVNAHEGDIGKFFCEIFTNDGKRIAFLAGPTSIENVERIVSCVNAFKGVTSEEIDGISFLGGVKGIMERAVKNAVENAIDAEVAKRHEYALRNMMCRLTELLDEDQFNEMVEICNQSGINPE